ncbi:Galactose oxidase protein [Rutstroemia sp. NJR-2017a BBW]|nr:Galactose oxidase protein [Rutstroemia sp. NJR-2017a BBW]
MRSTIIATVLIALVAAAPRPQSIDLNTIDALPDAAVVKPPVAVESDTPSIQPSAAATSIAAAVVTSTAQRRNFLDVIGAKQKRDACAVQPDGYGPVSSPDTADGFLNDQTYSSVANAASVPPGYSVAFSNLQGSSQTVSYLGLKTLQSYDTIGCAQYCDELAGCVAFNIYFERDPSVDPGTNCTNPSSITNYKCVRWGVKIGAETATNNGQWREQFQVVISGSNGYNKDAPPCTVSGFQGPTQLPGAINAPLDPITKTDTYMGYKFFSFDVAQTYQQGVLSCTAACTAQTKYNADHPPATGNPAVCNQVVVYVLSDNAHPQGIYCSMYTESWAANYATNIGQYRGSDYWSVSQAYSYIVDEYAAKYPPICDIGGCPGGSYAGGNNGGYGA